MATGSQTKANTSEIVTKNHGDVSSPLNNSKQSISNSMQNMNSNDPRSESQRNKLIH